MSTRTISCALLLAIAVAPIAWGGASFNREIRYPTQYETKSGPNGVVVVPTKFKTRETGSILNVHANGIVRYTTRNGEPAVQLELSDGRSLVTQKGKLIKLDGTVYRAAGWVKGSFILVAQNSTKRMVFKRPD